MWILALSVTATAAAAAWTRLAAARAEERRAGFTLHALLGGAAAFGLALVVYEAAIRLGVDVRWERLARGDGGAFLLAGVVGLVEEAAKLAGILLVVDRGVRTRTAVAVGFGVGAGFSTLETLVTFAADPGALALGRAFFGPIAHALLLVPAALGVAPALRGRRPALALALPLAGSAALHGAGDLSLALSGVGYTGYALALAAPALVLFARARRRPIRSTAAQAEGAPATAGAAPAPVVPGTLK